MAKKKRFLDSIGSALRENVVEEIILERKIIPKRKLGFLDMMESEDVLKGDALDAVMPTREIVKKKLQSPQPKMPASPMFPHFSQKTGSKRPPKSVEYSAELYTELLEKSRDIAAFRKISINEVINEAMTEYMNKYWDISMMGEE